MTIAAGFVVGGGGLLFADNLFSPGVKKEKHDKLFSWTKPGLATVFALLGHASLGRMVVDECREEISKIAHDISIRDVLAKVRHIFRRIYREYVDTRPIDERQIYSFGILLALATQNEKPALF